MIPNDGISFQLFSSRASTDLDAQLKVLSELGYTDVQPFFFAPPDDMAAVARDADRVRAHGLTAKSGHFTMDIFDTATDQVATGAGLMVVEHDKPRDWQRFARRSMEAIRGFTAEIRAGEFRDE